MKIRVIQAGGQAVMIEAMGLVTFVSGADISGAGTGLGFTDLDVDDFDVLAEAEAAPVEVEPKKPSEEEIAELASILDKVDTSLDPAVMKSVRDWLVNFCAYIRNVEQVKRSLLSSGGTLTTSFPKLNGVAGHYLAKLNAAAGKTWSAQTNSSGQAVVLVGGWKIVGSPKGSVDLAREKADRESDGSVDVAKKVDAYKSIRENFKLIPWQEGIFLDESGTRPKYPLFLEGLTANEVGAGYGDFRLVFLAKGPPKLIDVVTGEIKDLTKDHVKPENKIFKFIRSRFYVYSNKIEPKDKKRTVNGIFSVVSDKEREQIIAKYGAKLDADAPPAEKSAETKTPEVEKEPAADSALFDIHAEMIKASRGVITLPGYLGHGMAWEKLQKSIDDEGHDFYSKYWPKTVQASTWVKAVFYTESRTKGKYIIISSASSFPYPLYYVSSTQLFEPAPEALIPGPLSVLAKKESSLSKEEEHEQEEKLREYVVSTGELSHIVSDVVEILGKWYEQSSDKRAQLRKSLPKGKPKS